MLPLTILRLHDIGRGAPNPNAKPDRPAAGLHHPTSSAPSLVAHACYWQVRLPGQGPLSRNSPLPSWRRLLIMLALAAYSDPPSRDSDAVLTQRWIYGDSGPVPTFPPR